jgi:hypothetical protein
MGGAVFLHPKLPSALMEILTISEGETLVLRPKILFLVGAAERPPIEVK